MGSKLRRLDPEEELSYLKELMGADDPVRLLERVTQGFHVLQTRSAMLISLVALCLTISGFSGPQIAASNVLSRWGLALGLALVVGSALFLMSGPLRLRWVTRWRCETTDESIIALIHQRNQRTRRYHIAVALLACGLAAYVTALVVYLLLH